MNNKKEARRIIFILVCIIIMFLALIVYLTYFQIFKAETVKVNNYNKRLWLNEEKIVRGSILDRNGLELATTDKTENGNIRRYNYGNLYSHIIGYSYREYGKSGLEHSMNKTLLGMEENSTIDEIKNLLKEEKKGKNIKISIDHGLQELAREQLKGKKGAAIVQNPKTGEIYAMVSYPDFNAANLKEEWQTIMQSMEGPLLNRATQGLYEPGSTFKEIVASSILNNKEVDGSFNCQGSVVIDGYKFKDYRETAHGETDLNQALTKSCNSYFVKKTSELGQKKLKETTDSFYINKDIPFELPVEKSRLDLSKTLSKTELAATGIGQGKVLMTPLNMVMATSAIANDGIMMEPSLVKDIIDGEGKLAKRNMPKELSSVLQFEDAKSLQLMMQNVVDNGTGKAARVSGYKIGGKTGTAENASGKTHAWFTGFGPVEDPEFSVVVVLEEDGSNGGITAAPIAGRLLNYALKNIE